MTDYKKAYTQIIPKTYSNKAQTFTLKAITFIETFFSKHAKQK